MRSVAPHVLAILVAVGLGGCTLLVGDKVDPLTPDDSPPNLSYRLVAFEPHVGQLTELFVVSDDGFIQARAIYDPLPSPDVTVELQNVIAPNVRRVDFYSDLNNNRMIDPSEEDPIDPMRRLFPDHMWRDTVGEDGEGEFVHSTNFTDITTDRPAQSTGGAFVLRLTDVEAFIDQPARVWVVDSTARDVGFYQLGSVAVSPLEIRIPGIIDDGTEYEVEIELGRETILCASARGNATGLTLDASAQSLLDCTE